MLFQSAHAVELPPIPRGPAYQSAFAREAEFQDAAYDLQEDHPALALVVVVGEGELSEWSRDVRGDFPCFGVVRRAVPEAGRAVRCTWSGAAWSFEEVAGPTAEPA